MNIEVVIEKDYDAILVRITHNGFQWSSFRLDSMQELETLKEKIDDFLCIEETKNGDDVCDCGYAFPTNGYCRFCGTRSRYFIKE